MLDALPPSFPYQLAHHHGLSDRALKRYVEDGWLERLGHGVYRKTDAPPADLDQIEIALRAPDATLCLTSALSLHGLTDIIPSAIDVALPRSRRPPRLSVPVRWHRFHEPTFFVGRRTLEVDAGVMLGLYSPERCIVDAFRLGHTEGLDVATEALKRWIKRPDATPSALLEVARWFPNVEPPLLHALRILL